MKELCVNGHDTTIVGRTHRHCRECVRQQSRARYAADPTYAKEQRKEWVRRYNLVKKQMFDHQNGLCLFCGLELPDDLTKIALDHDHSCHPGKYGCPKCYRGLLHLACNVAVGRVEHDKNSIETAIKYLKGLLK